MIPKPLIERIGPRGLEVIELALSYLAYNLNNVVEVFGVDEGDCLEATDMLFVQSRYIAKPTENEVDKLLDLVTEANE